jgi:hypothetical protein
MDDNLDQYSDYSSSSQALNSDLAADDGARNLPSPSKWKKQKHQFW